MWYSFQLDQAVPNMEDYYGDAYYSSFTMKSIRMQIPRFIIQPILFLSSKGFPKNGKCFRYLNKIVKISFPYMTPIKDLIAEYWTWGMECS